eukprot:226386-Amphidinium_carterae.2
MPKPSPNDPVVTVSGCRKVSGDSAQDASAGRLRKMTSADRIISCNDVPGKALHAKGMLTE